jgi:hypothetical protein
MMSRVTWRRGTRVGRHTGKVGLRRSEPKERGERRFRLGLEGVMCVVGAILVAVVGGAQLTDLYWLAQRGEVVTATVLDEENPVRGPSRITVRFVTQAGETVEGDTANYLDAEVGKTIQVVYDPRLPGRMQAADWGFDYWVPCLWLTGTVVFLLFAWRELWPGV